MNKTITVHNEPIKANNEQNWHGDDLQTATDDKTAQRLGATHQQHGWFQPHREQRAPSFPVGLRNSVHYKEKQFPSELRCFRRFIGPYHT